MSWISPTFGDSSEASTSNPKRRKTTETSVTDTPINIPTTISTSRSNWLEKYSPKCVDDVVVNVKKVKELETWLQQTISNKSGSKFLLLKGPSGSGKTTTLQVLCQKLSVKTVEWITPLEKSWVNESDFISRYEFTQNTAKQFEEFLFRSSRYGSCISSSLSRKIILVKDFPNVFLHSPPKFHETLENVFSKCVNPVVFICSEESMCKNLFPATLQETCGIQSINFNSIPDSRMVKVLKRVLIQECKLNKNTKLVTDEVLNALSVSCQGDIRSALSKLYFSTINSKFEFSEFKHNKVKKSKKCTDESAITHKDNKIDFFHGIGRVLYPKKIESQEGLKFVHSTVDIVETFLTEPNKLLNQLYENYPTKLGNVQDLSNAAERLSCSDILISRWQEKDIFHTYSLSVAVQGLMVSNKNPQKAKFEAFRKSLTSRVDIDSKSLQMEGKSLFTELSLLNYGRLLDMLPFSRQLLPDMNQSQLEYVRRVCHFKQ